MTIPDPHYQGHAEIKPAEIKPGPKPFILPNGAVYDNPRGMPEKWIVAYLKRHPEMLAIDVMRVWDRNAATERMNLRLRNTIAGMLFAYILQSSPKIIAFVYALVR